MHFLYYAELVTPGEGRKKGCMANDPGVVDFMILSPTPYAFCSLGASNHIASERTSFMNSKRFTLGRLFLAGAIAASLGSAGYASGAAEPGLVTMTVTAVGKKDTAPPALAKNDVELYQGKEKVQIADWRKSDPLLLAIVIDESLGSNIASQWNDLKAFIMSQPATTFIGVFYGRNGTVSVAQDFTADHALAAKALRIPIGGLGAFSSPYLELQDMIKRWPENNERKSIILISSGIDYFRGNFGPTSPDLDPTIDRAQKTNVNVWDDLRTGRRSYGTRDVPDVQRAIQLEPAFR